jgi:hypothetical protein
MKTQKEFEDFERRAMGATAADLIAANEYLYDTDKVMLAMSILSDAQELLADDAEQNAERVRQYINRAKYVLRADHEERRDPHRGS